MYEALQYHSMVLDILCLTYFLISITMPDPQTSDMRQIPYVKWCLRFLFSSR